MADARLIPCLITETATWKFTIHFGTPVPQHHIGRSLDMQAIGSHLLREFSKVVTKYPEQCQMRCLRAMWPLSDNDDLRSFRSASSGRKPLIDIFDRDCACASPEPASGYIAVASSVGSSGMLGIAIGHL